MEPANVSADTADHPSATGTRRRRGVLAGLALVLTCVVIVVTSVAIWVHQVALDTDRFTALVTDVVDDPALIDPVAAKVSAQVVTALDLESRIAEQLPGPSTLLAAPIAAAVEEAIDRQLQQVLEDPRVQAGLLASLRFTHEHLVTFLRGDSSALTVVDGYLYLDVFPVIGAALTEVQSLGLIPADVQLPDLSSGEAPAVLADRLESTLEVTLPADFGTVRLMEARRLAAAQAAVQAFDAIVVILVVLCVVLAALTLWLARDRRRMVVYLALGIVIAFILARVALRGLASAIATSVADAGVAGAVTAIVDAAVADLIGLTGVILVVTAALGLVAYIAGRPAWLRRLVSRSSGRAATAGPAPAADRGTLEQAGIAAILFSVAWIALGIEVALLGALLVGAWLLVVRIVAGPSGADGGGSAASGV
jgi:hypothetical protein